MAFVEVGFRYNASRIEGFLNGKHAESKIHERAISVFI
jgi:hypothetical protein